MESNTFILICAVEVIAITLFVVILLIIRNRKLQKALKTLKAQASELQNNIKKMKAQSANAIKPTETTETYRDKITQQLELTQRYHQELASCQDIALDLDPSTPTPRRTAALRNAFLIAEKEATSHSKGINWDLLNARYQQIIDFNNDYAASPPHLDRNEPATPTEEPPPLTAKDQHKIINELLAQLRDLVDSERPINILDTLQSELRKQSRFLEESETCVQLMDNELTTANRELEALRDEMKDLPLLRASLKELEQKTST